MSERTAEPALLSRIDRLREAIDKAVDLLNTAWGGFGPSEPLEQGITTLQHARTADDIAQGRDWPPAMSAPDTLSEKPGLDVERLARALNESWGPEDIFVDDTEVWRMLATRVLAALGSTDSEGRS